jgi:hypothetical protein
MRPTLEDIRGLSNLTQAFRWNIAIEAPVAIDSAAFNLRCLTAGIPVMAPQATETTIRGHKIKEPGIATFTNTIDVTCVEAVDNTIANFIREWRELCWSVEGGVTGVMQDKADLEGKVIMFRLDNLDNPIYQYELIGVFIENATFGDLAEESADPFKPTITFSYDYFTEAAL